MTASLYWVAASPTALLTLAQVSPYALTPSGSPANQSSASFSGSTCSISHERP
uniref:hypothetical protein n=1 Tax=Saccharopolyspora elongata TaxID=2530387 RepID=UPI0014045385|nr:hypothetical protein [Saccharopolyspora elongata]